MPEQKGLGNRDLFLSGWNGGWQVNGHGASRFVAFASLYDGTTSHIVILQYRYIQTKCTFNKTLTFAKLIDLYQCQSQLRTKYEFLSTLH